MLGILNCMVSLCMAGVCLAGFFKVWYSSMMWLVGYCMVVCKVGSGFTLGWLETTFTFLCESRSGLKPLITAEKAF